MKRKRGNKIWIIPFIIFCLTGFLSYKHILAEPKTSASWSESQGTGEAKDQTEGPTRAKPDGNTYLVKVSIAKQKVTVYQNDNLIKTITCSTGLFGEDTATPEGKYKINSSYGTSFFSKKYNEGAKYWVGFIKSTYLFHSVPTDKDGNIIEEEADKLGSPASHGCVRMPMDDAIWFYENVPAGSDVEIA